MNTSSRTLSHTLIYSLYTRLCATTGMTSSPTTASAEATEPARPVSSQRNSRRLTARLSTLGLFANIGNERTIEEEEDLSNRRRTIVDPFPPQLAPLNLPHPEVNLQSPRSPSSIRSMIDGAANPQINGQWPSAARTIQGGHVPIQTPAPVLQNHSSVTANPASEVADSALNRHPADTLPDRHPADPLPAQSVSAGSEISAGSGRARWLKRRARLQAGQPKPQSNFLLQHFPALRYLSVRRKLYHCITTLGIGLLILIVCKSISAQSLF